VKDAHGKFSQTFSIITELKQSWEESSLRDKARCTM
jgi:hypothetical protein